MNYENIIAQEKKYNYEVIKQMEEHAKKYNEATDKKEFLKNISPYEQKFILLNSHRPYEVLNYLDELDLKNTDLIINNLTDQEIINILDLFTSEDKKRFYSRFSDLELVNRFIKFDKNAWEHVDDLTINRKVELLNSSDKELALASEKIYESMSESDKKVVLDKVSTIDGISALNEVVSEKETPIISEKENETKNIEKNVEKQEQLEEVKEEEKDNKEQEIDKEQEKKNIIFEFFKINIKYYIELFPHLKDVDINTLTFDSIPVEMIFQIEKDYEFYKKQKEEMEKNQENIENTDDLSEFQIAKEKCEEQIIQSIAIDLNNQIEKEEVEMPEINKTL